MGPFVSRAIVFGATIASFGAIWAGVQSVTPAGQHQSPFVGEAHAAEKAKIIPAPRLDANEKGTRAVAIFAGGCFWGVEGVFEHTKGVISAASGYHGGTKRSASYKLVSAGLTNHAEAVRVVYNPQQISYGQLMQIFLLSNRRPDDAQLGKARIDGKHYRTALGAAQQCPAKGGARLYHSTEQGPLLETPDCDQDRTAQGLLFR